LSYHQIQFPIAIHIRNFRWNVVESSGQVSNSRAKSTISISEKYDHRSATIAASVGQHQVGLAIIVYIYNRRRGDVCKSTVCNRWAKSAVSVAEQHSDTSRAIVTNPKIDHQEIRMPVGIDIRYRDEVSFQPSR
jgi:hypothetical protein